MKLLILGIFAAAVWSAECLSLQEVRALQEKLSAFEEDLEERQVIVIGQNDDHVQVLKVDDPADPEDGSIVVVDYDKSLAGVYDAAGDHCYLIGGVSQNLDVNRQQEFAKVDDYEVKDKSLVPNAIKAQCEDKPVDWLERADSGKLRRGWCVRVCAAFVCWNNCK